MLTFNKTCVLCKPEAGCQVAPAYGLMDFTCLSTARIHLQMTELDCSVKGWTTLDAKNPELSIQF